MHSHDYRTPFSFVDKQVLVIGIGNSGSDIAVETSVHAKSVCKLPQSRHLVFNYYFRYILVQEEDAGSLIESDTKDFLTISLTLRGNNATQWRLLTTLTSFNRIFFSVLKILPKFFLNYLFSNGFKSKFDHSIFALKPSHYLFSQVIFILGNFPFLKSICSIRL